MIFIKIATCLKGRPIIGNFPVSSRTALFYHDVVDDWTGLDVTVVGGLAEREILSRTPQIIANRHEERPDIQLRQFRIFQEV